MDDNPKAQAAHAGDTRATCEALPTEDGFSPSGSFEPAADAPFFDWAMPLPGDLAPDQAKLAELQKRTFRGQCKGVTPAGTRCLRNSVFANGLCNKHGGKNPPEYIAFVLARLKHNAERKLRRAAKRARKAAQAGLRIVGGAHDI